MLFTAKLLHSSTTATATYYIYVKVIRNVTIQPVVGPVVVLGVELSKSVVPAEAGESLAGAADVVDDVTFVLLLTGGGRNREGGASITSTSDQSVLPETHLSNHSITIVALCLHV